MIPPAAGGLYPTCFADFVGNLVKLRGRREKRERERGTGSFSLVTRNQSTLIGVQSFLSNYHQGRS